MGRPRCVPAPAGCPTFPTSSLSPTLEIRLFGSAFDLHEHATMFHLYGIGVEVNVDWR